MVFTTMTATNMEMTNGPATMRYGCDCGIAYDRGHEHAIDHGYDRRFATPARHRVCTLSSRKAM